MINKLKIKTGLLKKTIKGNTIKFTPDINIITGKCGSGKSILLKTITHYHLNNWEKGGNIELISCSNYNKIITDFNLKYYRSSKEERAKALHEFSEFGKCEIDMDFSYQYYLTSDIIKDDFNLFGGIMCDSSFKVIDMDYYRDNMKGVSSGQNTLSVFRKLIADIKPKKIADINVSNCNEYDKRYYNVIEEIYGDNIDKKPVLILDEPDTSMDLYEQKLFYSEFVPKLAEKWQVIISSHSIFAHQMENVNHIRLDNHFEELGL